MSITRYNTCLQTHTCRARFPFRGKEDEVAGAEQGHNKKVVEAAGGGGCVWRIWYICVRVKKDLSVSVYVSLTASARSAMETRAKRKARPGSTISINEIYIPFLLLVRFTFTASKIDTYN